MTIRFNDKCKELYFSLSFANRQPVVDALLSQSFMDITTLKGVQKEVYDGIMEEQYIMEKELKKYIADKVAAVKDKKEKTILFKESIYYTNDNKQAKGKLKFIEDLKKENFGYAIDYGYYWYALRDWSEQGNKKVNWLSTAKNFIRKDIKDKKVAVKAEVNRVKHFADE